MAEIADKQDSDSKESEESDDPTGKSKRKKKKKRVTAEQRLKERRAEERRVVKKGKKVDPYKSTVPNPDDIPDENNEEVQKVLSMWKIEKLKELTYTQFWTLVHEGHVEKAVYGGDDRALTVTLKDSAPGGARVEKVGLPYDPNLYNHMLKHGVYIERKETDMLDTIFIMCFKMTLPILACYALVQFSFKIGQKKKEDEIFGGANLEMLTAKQSNVTFSDVAGIDMVKDEIKEVVAFLKNPKKFTDLGARSPAGILMVGPPGTGKTLLAKAIAGESGVPFFATAGTEFSEMYVGVGASRVRDMFKKARESAPCILFIDEFDGIGQKRSSEGGDESVHTINQLLTELDGFEDNSGVIVIAATNRPNSLDSALTRPGRFDRILHLPLPNTSGRVEILQVHSRDKLIDPEIDFRRISRATAGFTGAQLMDLMNQSAIVACRQRRDLISELDIFEALEIILKEKRERGMSGRHYDEEIIPDEMRKGIAIYEAGKALVGLMSPSYDEVYKVTICPGGMPTGSTLFLPREERLESRVITRGYMEAKLTVCFGGRCAERLLMGDANISTAGAADLNVANGVAKEMIYRCGFSKHLGPVSLMDAEDVAVAEYHRTPPIANISTDLARIAFEECLELLDAAEAKAYYGLITNYDFLTALIERLMDDPTISIDELTKMALDKKLMEFRSPYLAGFGWDHNGRLIYPGAEAAQSNGTNGRFSNVRKPNLDDDWDPANPYRLRTDLSEILQQSFGRHADRPTPSYQDQ